MYCWLGGCFPRLSGVAPREGCLSRPDRLGQERVPFFQLVSARYERAAPIHLAHYPDLRLCSLAEVGLSRLPGTELQGLARVPRPHVTSQPDVGHHLAAGAESQHAGGAVLEYVSLCRHGLLAHNARQASKDSVESSALEPAFGVPSRRYRAICGSRKPMSLPSHRLSALAGSQVGSHSGWTEAVVCGRWWNRKAIAEPSKDGWGRRWTPLGDLRIRRLGVRVPPGVLSETPA